MERKELKGRRIKNEDGKTRVEILVFLLKCMKDGYDATCCPSYEEEYAFALSKGHTPGRVTKSDIIDYLKKKDIVDSGDAVKSHLKKLVAKGYISISIECPKAECKKINKSNNNKCTQCGANLNGGYYYYSICKNMENIQNMAIDSDFIKVSKPDLLKEMHTHAGGDIVSLIADALMPVIEEQIMNWLAHDLQHTYDVHDESNEKNLRDARQDFIGFLSSSFNFFKDCLTFGSEELHDYFHQLSYNRFDIKGSQYEQLKLPPKIIYAYHICRQVDQYEAVKEKIKNDEFYDFFNVRGII